MAADVLRHAKLSAWVSGSQSVPMHQTKIYVRFKFINSLDGGLEQGIILIAQTIPSSK